MADIRRRIAGLARWGRAGLLTPEEVQAVAVLLADAATAPRVLARLRASVSPDDCETWMRTALVGPRQRCSDRHPGRWATWCLVCRVLGEGY